MEMANHQTKVKRANESHALSGDFEPIYQPEADEIERLREELAAEKNARLRLAAEFDNYRRRTRKEMAQAGEEGKRELLERLISIADDLDLALDNIGDARDAVADGLRMIHRRFREMLEANNVAAFESKGEAFDPERHEAFDVTRAAEESEAGTVHSEIRRGYFWRDKLLRPALVVVAQ